MILQEVFLTKDYICIAMEYASGGNLFSYVKQAIRLKEAASRWFFQQLIIGLDYCHKMGVVNRDIKLENTLLQVEVDLWGAVNNKPSETMMSSFLSFSCSCCLPSPALPDLIAFHPVDEPRASPPAAQDLRLRLFQVTTKLGTQVKSRNNGM